MAGSSSQKAVVLALAGNGLLTVLKFGAFAFSGSGAMLSEGIHSLADTCNQALLFVGIKRSERPASPMFHYGFGGERFLFALFSAIGIFVLGAGVTIYHGIHSALHPPELTIGYSSYVVLAIAFVVDGGVLYSAVCAVNEAKGKHGFLEYLRDTSDPTIAAVLLEDGVACLGVLVAVVGIALSSYTGSTWPDVTATLIIGLMLAGVAIWLGMKNFSLILGPAIPVAVEEDIVAYLRAQPSIAKVASVKSRVVGADRFRFQAEIEWDGREIASGLDGWCEEQSVEWAQPAARAEFLREFGQALTTAVGDEVDRLEKELRERHPELAFLDFEDD